MKRLVCLCVALAFSTFGATASARPSDPVPQGFFGVTIDGPATDIPGVLEAEIARIQASGVRRLRFRIDWSTAQPYRTFGQLPAATDRQRYTDVAGVPTDFTTSDRIIRLAAAEKIRTLPVIVGRPKWASDADYGRFLAALAVRYGTGGTFWPTARVPVRPVREWQISEVIGRSTDMRTYGRQLRSASSVLDEADDKALVMSAAIAGKSSTISKRTRELVRAAGRSSFDVLALRPSARDANGMISGARAARRSLKARRSKALIAVTGLPLRSDLELRAIFRAAAQQRDSLRLSAVTVPTWLAPQGASAPTALNQVVGQRIERKRLLFVFREALNALTIGGA